MSCACTPVLVGVVSLISEVQLPFKNVQISLWGMDYIYSMSLKNFNQSESVQKIPASRR